MTTVTLTVRPRGPFSLAAGVEFLEGFAPAAFGAELILLRGAAHPDVFPRHERRLHRIMAAAYELTDPSIDELAAIAEQWRPYRTWAAFLLRARAAAEARLEVATASRPRGRLAR